MKNKILLGLPLAVLALISFVAAHEGADDFGHHGMMSGWWGYGMGVFGWILSILVIVVLVLLIAWLIKKMQEPQRRRR